MNIINRLKTFSNGDFELSSFADRAGKASAIKVGAPLHTVNIFPNELGFAAAIRQGHPTTSLSRNLINHASYEH